MLIGTNFNFDQNQLILPVIHNLTSAPGSGLVGQLYTNTTTNTLNVYVGSAWATIPTTPTGGSAVTNAATYWVNPTTLGGIQVTNGLLGFNSSSVPSAVQSTVQGAALVAQTTAGPVFGTVVLTQPASAATLTLASGSTLTTAANVTHAGAFATTITATATTNVTLPTSGTLVGSADTGTVTNTMLAGSIVNAKLVNSSVTYGSTNVALGATSTVIAGLTNLTFLAGTTTVAPLNLSTVGSVLTTTPVVGAIEWDQVSIYVTNAGPTRRKLLYADFSNISAGAGGVLPPQYGGTGVANASGSTITLGGTISTAGSLTTSAGNVTIANTFTTGSTVSILGALSIGNTFTTLGTFTSGGTFSTSSTFSVTGALNIAAAFTTTAAVSFTGAVSTSAAFSTTGTGTLALANNGTNSTLTLPGVATANLTYNTSNPASANLLAYSGSATGLLNYVAAPSALAVLTQSASGAPAFVNATGTGSPVMGTNPTMSFATAGTLTLNYNPVSGTDAVNKTYVDNVAIGLTDWKESVRVATIGNVSLSAAPNTLDGVALAANNRILVKNQTLPVENGIYEVTSVGTGANGVWTRTSDANISAEVTPGMYVYVEEGTATNKGQYVLNTIGTIILGTTPLNFVRFNGGSTLVAGNGIDITGDSLSVKVNSSTTYLQYAIPYFDTTSTISRVALPGTANLALAGATAGAPYWSTLVITPTGGANATLSLAASSTLALTGGYSTTLASSASTTLTLPAASGTLAYYTSGNAPTSANQVPFTAGVSGSLQYTALNTTATGYFLKQTSSGAPAFAALTAADLNTAYGVSGALSVAKKYYTTITGTGPSFVISGATHGIGNAYLTVAIYDANLGSANANLMMADVTVNYSTKDVTITFGYGVPGASTYTVVITG